MKKYAVPKYHSKLPILIMLLLPSLLFAETILDPVDTSSPRSTYRSFITDMEIIRLSMEKEEADALYFHTIDRIIDSFDLSDIPDPDREDTAKETAMMLIEILGRINQPDYEDIPDEEEMTALNLHRWRIPGTDIELARMNDENREGEYLFSADSVEKIPDIYKKARLLPYKKNAWQGAYNTYLSVPGIKLPYNLTRNFPEWLLARVFKMAIWKLISLLIILTGLVAGTWAVLSLIRKINRSEELHPLRAKLLKLILAFGLMIMFRTSRVIITDYIGIRGRPQDILSHFAYGAAILSLVYGVFVTLSIFYTVVTTSKNGDDTSINNHLIKVITQLIAVMAASIIVVSGLNYLGFEIVPVLAGLGIGGIAVALAAQSTIENIIAGLTLFADKPVRVGDICQYGEELGIVEEIGIRSTRIRSLDDTLITIPNAQFAQMTLENHTRRKKFLYRTILQFRYETSEDQLRFLLLKLREMLLSHPKVLQERQRLRFIDFGAYSLNVELFAYIRARDQSDYRAIREDVNFRIMKIAKECGAEFAFPSTTAYIAQDAGINEPAVRQSEEALQTMKEEGDLPFPEFSTEERKAFKSSLNYPPFPKEPAAEE